MLERRSGNRRRTLVVGLCLLGLFAIVEMAGAQLPYVASRWEGRYEYQDRRAPVLFTLQLVERDGSIRGQTSEPATFGDGSSPYLYANISGRISGTSIFFTKTYDGTGGQNHSVEYRGTISRDGSIMSGTWSIGNAGGSFTATALDRGR